MKIRKGLVSNSSSSSFVCIMRKDLYDKVYEKAHPWERACMDAATNKDNVFGQDVMRFEEFSTPGGSCWEYFDDYKEEDKENYEETVSAETWPGEVTGRFIGKVYELDPIGCWSNSQDW